MHDAARTVDQTGTMTDDQWLTSNQVAHHLGVKLQTVYAYASRGVLHPVRHPGQRGSWFAASEIAALTGMSSVNDAGPRRRRRAPGLADDIRTSVTLLDEHDFRYRGHDVISLTATHSFEEVCGLLWRCDATTAFSPAEVPTLAGLGTAVPRAEPHDLLLLAVTLAGTVDPGRADLTPTAVAAAGARCIATGVAALGGEARGRPGPGQVAAAVATLATGRRHHRGTRLARLVDDALVLLADHDLALSTTAARVAASVRADPYAVLLAGLAAARSPAHGTASRAARALVLDAIDDPARVLGECLAGTRSPHGFGHRVLVEADRRADHLLGAVLPRATPRVRDAVGTLVDGLWERRGTPPNIDLALAVLTVVEDLRPDSGEILFALARMAGWTAHAIEEYGEEPLRFRLRGVYVGPR